MSLGLGWIHNMGLGWIHNGRKIVSIKEFVISRTFMMTTDNKVREISRPLFYIPENSPKPNEGDSGYFKVAAGYNATIYNCSGRPNKIPPVKILESQDMLYVDVGWFLRDFNSELFTVRFSTKSFTNFWALRTVP